jgi:hypothetical protein
MKKSWKEHLLSSGIPLEHSVAETVRSLGLTGPTEFKYERPNELGVPTVFSVDVHTSHVDTRYNQVWIDFFIECKYRHDSTNWVFTPEEDNYMNFEFGDRDLYNVLDEFSDGFELTAFPNPPDHSSRYPLCSRGIEILPQGPNPKSIDQAVQQLAYAVSDQTAEAIRHQMDHMLGHPSPVWLLVPIVVTTASLWRIRPGQTLDMIRNATDIDAIAEPKTVVVLHEPPDNLLRRFTRDKLKSHFSVKEQALLDGQLKKIGRHGFDFFCDVRATYYPSYWIVCHYSHLKTELQGILDRFGNGKALSKRKAIRPRPNKAVQAIARKSRSG